MGASATRVTAFRSVCMIVVSRVCGPARTWAERRCARGRDDAQRNPGAKHKQMELLSQKERQHRLHVGGHGILDVERQTDGPECTRDSNHADLVEAVRVPI